MCCSCENRELLYNSIWSNKWQEAYGVLDSSMQHQSHCLPPCVFPFITFPILLQSPNSSNTTMPLNTNTLHLPPSLSPSLSQSTKLVRSLLNIENSSLLFLPQSIILNHPTINPSIFTLKLQHRLCCDSFQHEMIITMRTVLV